MLRRTSSRREVTFAWLRGQPDNLGDAVLRREFVAALQAEGREIVALVPAGCPDYAHAMGVSKCTQLDTFGAWWWAVVRASVSDDCVLALHAGEMNVGSRNARYLAVLLPAVVLCRVLGGRVVWAGMGLRGRGGLTTPLVMLTARLADVVAWRDEATRRRVGRGDVMPDWAFGAVSNSGGAGVRRTRLTISMRYDSDPPTDDWCERVRRCADRLGLHLTVTYQVRRDHLANEQLAARLESDFHGWTEGTSLLEREAQVRQCYSESHGVISDRLHVLILAATHGAPPLVLLPANRTKVEQGFAAIGLALVADDDVGSVLESMSTDSLSDLSARLLTAVDAARDRVVRVRRRIAVARDARRRPNVQLGAR